MSCDIGIREAKTLYPSHHLFHLLVSANREPKNLVRYLFDIHKLREVYGELLDIHHVHTLLEQRNVLSRLSSLPLAKLGWGEWTPPKQPSLLDRLWSEASRYMTHSRGEWAYALFPFLDYYLHFRGCANAQIGFWQYLQRRLQVKSLGDFLHRTLAKIRRML